MYHTNVSPFHLVAGPDLALAHTRAHIRALARAQLRAQKSANPDGNLDPNPDLDRGQNQGQGHDLNQMQIMKQRIFRPREKRANIRAEEERNMPENLAPTFYHW